MGDKLWLKHAEKIAKLVESKRDDMKALSDEALKEKTDEFKARIKKGESLDAILPEAFAVAREAAFRVDGKEPYHVQIIGGIALHEGKIAEMKTGEGKTLVAVLPSYLNALEGKGVHVVTVNDYLAGRDAASMGKIHEFLGLTVGCILEATSPYFRKKAYACDITYITNAQLGFDYLRDNMAPTQDDVVQRGLHYAIIDEVDSILIDEARTPLIISGDGKDVSKIYIACDALAKKMIKGEETKEFNKIDALLGDMPEETGDFIYHEKERNITLTEAGVKKVEKYFGIDNYADRSHAELQHVMDLALRANYTMFKDKDYIVRDGAVLIVDTFTGRIMEGRQYSDGLHQAIEAKEGVPIQQATATIATTTYQNFFRKYDKFSGMTGTAYTEKKEFKHTYGLDTVVIPTNKPVIRVDRPDVIYITKEGKYKGVVEEVKKTHAKGQPVLIGTASVRTSEEVSDYLDHEGIPHQVLNAKQDAEEANIIALAGKYGAVTVATNMAGRGTDIILDDKAKAAGGLKVIGTERHESQRIDNQLRGRSGRQGDPGESVFFLSTDDDMVRLFGTDKLKKVLLAGGFDPNQPVDSKLFAKAVIKAQKTVEDNHFGTRKNVFDYDKINDKQRELIYAERRKLLAGDDVSDQFDACMKEAVRAMVETYTDKGKVDYKTLAKAFTELSDMLVMEGTISGKNKKELQEFLYRKLKDEYDRKFPSDENGKLKQMLVRNAILVAVDTSWKEQLKALDFLRQDIWYQGYAQIDPKSAYAIEAFHLYDGMKDNIYRIAVMAFFHYKVEKAEVRKEGV